MAVYTLLPSASRTNFDQTGTFNPPDTIDVIQIVITVADFSSPANTIRVVIEESLNAGATWGPLTDNTFTGGAIDRNTGLVNNTRRVTITMGPDDRRNRRLRARIVTVGTLTFGVTAETQP